MAYIASAARRPSTLSAACCALMRAMSTSAAATTSSSSGASATSKGIPQGTRNGKGGSIKEPSYTYLPPGSSLREPLYISLSDPVYYYDIPPSKPSLEVPAVSSSTAAAVAAGEVAPLEEKAAAGAQFTLPFTSISGAQKPDTRRVAYRMADDMSQVPYVVSLNNSMREPRYVSISDPAYVPDAKKKGGQ